MHDQSPIDLPTTALEVAAPPRVAHRPARWRWRAGEYAHGADPIGSAGHVEVDGVALPVVEVHSHTPSEHTWDGRRRDGELHVVHSDGVHLLVLGFGLTVGAHSRPVQDLLDGEGSVADLLTTTSAVTYIGSQTTPPYTPGVRWVVLIDPLDIAPQQLAALSGGQGGNARPLQPIGDRRPALTDLSTA